MRMHAHMISSTNFWSKQGGFWASIGNNKAIILYVPCITDSKTQ